MVNTSDSKRNFKESERIINAGHIIYCGKNIDFNGSVRLSAYTQKTDTRKITVHIWIITADTRKITVCSSTFYGVTQYKLHFCQNYWNEQEKLRCAPIHFTVWHSNFHILYHEKVLRSIFGHIPPRVVFVKITVSFL